MEFTREECLRLLSRWEKIKCSYQYPLKYNQFKELEVRVSNPDLWKDTKIARKINQEYSNLKDSILNFQQADTCAEYVQIALDLNSIKECYKFYEYLLQYCNDFELNQQFSEESDKLPALVKITAGAGGTEAQDWASMVFRMYLQWAKKHNYSITVENYIEAEDAGIKTATLKVEGLAFPYGTLKGETGIHRLVRVSPFNAQGKRMTSFCAVHVTPLIDDTFEVNVSLSDITFDYFRSGGAGGQNVNKVESGVRARYWWTNPETGEKEEILVENTETRDQPKNKENAIRILRSRVYEKELAIKRKKEKELEDSKDDNGWGNQKRSYVLDDSRVKDHHTDYQDFNPDSVLNGDIDEFLKANILNNA